MSFIKRKERGQALILIVLAIIGTIGLVALAIDGGNAFMNRRHAQAAADAAALASAYAKVNNDLNWLQIGFDRASSNGYANGVNATITIVSPPGTGCNNSTNPYIGQGEYIQVIINSSVATYFAPVVGIQETHSCVESISRAKPAITAPMVFGNSIVSLNPHDCSAFRIHGTSDTTAIGGGIFVNSDSNCVQGALNQSGNGGLNAPAACVVGSSSYTSGKLTPAPTHCDALPYPPEIIFPTPSCASNGGQTGSKKDGYLVSPGNIPANYLEGKVTLQPGIYCITGSATINAQDVLIGNGVLLYFINGGLHINGGATVNISSPLTGDFAGLLIYLPLGNTSPIILNGNSSSMFTGSVLAPSSEVQINGTGYADSYNTQIVSYTVDLIGTANTTIRYDDNRNYDATIPPKIEIVK